MPRQDIYFNAPYGEVETTDNLTRKFIHEFSLTGETEQMDNEKYVFGETIVPYGFENKYKEGTEICIHIPYFACYKELCIRFRTDLNSGEAEYLLNPQDNKQWFTVFRETGQGEKEPVRLSEFYLYNEKGNFNLIFRDGYLALYSANETDFYIKAALPQNETFLLKAMPGNLYNHPRTGVGLIEFLHGNFENNGLAAKLQEEFTGDGMIINNAFMDSHTGELHLDVKEKNG